MSHEKSLSSDIKNICNSVREIIKPIFTDGNTLSHCQIRELVAAYIGYKSMSSLLADTEYFWLDLDVDVYFSGYNIEYSQAFYEPDNNFTDDFKFPMDRVKEKSKKYSVPLSDHFYSAFNKAMDAVTTPKCDNCEDSLSKTYPAEGKKGEVFKWLCDECIEEELNHPYPDVSNCRYCDDDRIYDVNLLKNGLCPEHVDEDDLDDEEREDLDSYIEYGQNHDFF